MVDREEFAELLYGTVISSKESDEKAFEKLSRIRKWLLNNTPKRLFRFRRCSDYSIEALKEDQIWGTSIWEFNDPYECVPCYDFETLWNKINQSLNGQNIFSLINSLKEGGILPEVKRAYPSVNIEQLVKNIPAQISGQDIEEKLQLFKNYLNNFIGVSFEEIVQRFYISIQAEEAKRQIACFSEQNSSTLMWGHYADSHKGFCLEYDFQAVLKNCTQKCTDLRGCNNFMLNFSLAPIIYNKKRFDASAYFSTVMQALLYEQSRVSMDLYYEDTLIVSKCLLTKSIDWEYENEWRLFTPHFNGEYRPYGNILCLKPVALYMGAKIAKENEKELYRICQEKGIKCYKMLQDFHGNEFAVRAEPYEMIINGVNGSLTN